MPFSANQGKDEIKRWYDQIALSKVESGSGDLHVLDIGVGSGTYARLLRKPVGDATRWTGIEIWEPYVERFALRQLYDHIICADARRMAETYARTLTRNDLYDVVIAGDVLEHMPVLDAVDLVENLKRITHYLVVSVPIVHWEQGAENGNPYEAHVYHYSADEMNLLLTGVGRYNYLYRSLHPDVGCWLWAAADTTEFPTTPTCSTCDGGGCPDCTDPAWS